MAINTQNISLAATPITTYNSTNETAVVYMSVCNHGAASVTVDIHVVPNGDSATVDNLIISALDITADDSYIVLPTGERLIMDNGDQIMVTASTSNDVSVVTSYVAI